MKLNKEIIKMFEDINFQIDNNDEVSLNKTSVKDQANQKIAFYANQEVYKNFINENKFEDCISYWQETNVKYLVQSNDELKEIIKKVNDCELYTINLNWLDTVNITVMSDLFYKMESFNGDISEWNMSNVENMSWMFWDAKIFNQDISNWDVSNVTDMNGMFYNAKLFNQPIGNWNVSNVKDMESMFYNASSFNQPIGNWDVSNVEDMSYMFSYTDYFNQDISNWDVSNIRTNNYIFYKCPIKEQYKPKFK